jgi:outer membrane protein OmpA-like peptidoglycan-associated protein
MLKKLILAFPLLLLLALNATAQNSSKSKSKDRFREKDDRRYPVRTENAKDLNSGDTDYAPMFYDGGIMFISSRSARGATRNFHEVYFSPFDVIGLPSTPTRFEFNVNKKSEFHEGPMSFSRDFKRAFITRTNNKDGVIKADKKTGKANLKIYETRFGFPDWTPPVELAFNSDEYSCKHPSMSVDGTKLFFSSDMPGGYGGFDLYVAGRTTDGWGEPVNLGPTINTAKNEVFPFMSLSGALFFASDGHANNLGGLDIYFVTKPLTDPSEIVNLAEPFNSAGNDHSFIIDKDGKRGFFASDRIGGYGKEDIYRFEADRGLEGTGKPEVNATAISVFDAKTGQPVQGASIRILQPSDDGFISGKNDFYTFDLLPVQNQPNALSLQLVRKGAEDLGTADLYSNADGTAKTEFTRYRSYLVLVSMDGYRPSERLISVDTEDALKLDFKLQDAPICLRSGGIVSTAEFGTRIANANLKFVHRASGHTEMVRTNLNGEFDACLPMDGDYVVYVQREGFLNENFKVAMEKGKQPYSEVRLRAVPGTNAEETMPLANGIFAGSVLVMDKIFYEYNKATLNQGATRHLDAIVDLMKKYPEMEIDLIAHTDTRGESRLNQELTNERAKNAKTYLVWKGVESERIKPVGKGETEPRNHCGEGVDCSDEEHQQNNRLEVHIRKLGKALRP